MRGLWHSTPASSFISLTLFLSSWTAHPIHNLFTPALPWEWEPASLASYVCMIWMVGLWRRTLVIWIMSIVQSSIKQDYLIFSYIYLCGGMCTCIKCQSKALPVELELQVAVSHLMWVLGVKPSEFNPWDPQGGRGESTTTGCSCSSTYTAHTYLLNTC